MGARISSRSNDNSTKKTELEKIFQSEGQTVTALLLIISKNVSTMEQLANQFDSSENIKELQNQLDEIQNHVTRLVKEAAADIQQLENLDNSKLVSSNRQLQNKRQKERLQDELAAAVKKFESVQRLVVEIKEKNMIRIKEQEMKTETQTISALILIISKKVHSMKQIVTQLCSWNPEEKFDPEQLLKELDHVYHYVDLLIDDASDCIKKLTESTRERLIGTGPISSDKQPHQTILLAAEVSTLHEIDELLRSVQRLDTEKQNVMKKINEFKTILRNKKSKK